MTVDQETEEALKSIEDVPRNSYLKIKREICQKRSETATREGVKNSQENTCARVEKETLAQVFSCQFVEILKTRLLQNTSGRLLLIHE